MVSRQSRKLVFLTCVCGTLVATIGHGQSVPSDGNWTQWRGPNRDNRSPERGLLKQWPKSGPPLAWKAEGLGRGIRPPRTRQRDGPTGALGAAGPDR